MASLLCYSFVVATFTSLTYAQEAAPQVSADRVADDTLQLMRQDIRSERKKIVAANLPLTDEPARNLMKRSITTEEEMAQLRLK